MKYLLIDDDKNVYNLIQAYLSEEETLLYRENTKDVLSLVESSQIDVIVFDIYLSDTENGLHFFERNKDFFNKKLIPVIFLSSNHQLKSKLDAFKYGASDYISKPFEPLELIARLRAQSLKRKKNEQVYRIGDLIFDLHSTQLYLDRPHEQERLSLTSTEYKLLYYLAKRTGEVISRENLIESVWGREYSCYW